jgi:hypothetical protein
VSDKTFAVVFSGKVAEGASVEQVKSNVAKLFKVELASVERLFTGARVVIKKGLDEATAKKYQAALTGAGAQCEVVNAAAPPAATAKSAPVKTEPVVAARAVAEAPAPSAHEVRSAPDAEPDTLGLTKSVVKKAPEDLGEFAAATLDEPGVVLVEHRDIAPPELDLSGLSMDKPGVILAEHEEVTPPELDVSGISMAEPGADIGKPEPAEELDVDVSGLSMDEPGAILVEHEEVPEPEIDTSGLSIA